MAGLTIKPTVPAPLTGLTIRPEVRYDRSLNGTHPFNDSSDQDMFHRCGGFCGHVLRLRLLLLTFGLGSPKCVLTPAEILRAIDLRQGRLICKLAGGLRDNPFFGR
jgi:hypothetical protein